MKHRVYAIFGLIVLLLTLSACTLPNGGGGPQAWLDRPLDNATLPLAPLTIQAHASDSDGIASFEFYVNDTLLSSVSSTSGRLGEASYEWRPSAPGIYSIKARATDLSGNVGLYATSLITITGEATPSPDVMLLDETPTTEAQPAENTPTLLEISSAECTDGLSVNVEINISHPDGIASYAVFSTWVSAETGETFNAPYPQTIQKRVQLTEPVADTVDRDHQIGLFVMIANDPDPKYAYIMESNNRCPGHYEGEPVLVPSDPIAPLVTAHTSANCRSGPSTAYGVITSLSEGQSAPIVGRNVNSSWWVIEPGSTDQVCWIAASTVDISGDISGVLVRSAPPLPSTTTPTPTSTTAPLQVTATPTPTTAPPSDTSPPIFYNTDVYPDSILTEGNGCPSYDRSTTVAASVGDESEIKKVIAYWNIDGTESGQVKLQLGGYGYSASIGPVNTAGTMSIFMEAQDIYGNVAQSGTLYVNVQNCIP